MTTIPAAPDSRDPTAARRRAPTRRCLPVLALVAAGCSSAPDGERDPRLEAQFAESRDRAREFSDRINDYPRVLTDLDKVIDQYVGALFTSDYYRSEGRAEKIEHYLRGRAEEHFPRLLESAHDYDLPRNRAIALAALGFSGRREALDPLVNACRDRSGEIVEAAVFGLAMLRDPHTPAAPIVGVMNDESYPEEMRAGAAWALYRLQLAKVDGSEIVATWLAVLERPLDAVDPGILMCAIRGIGQTRDPSHAPTVERFVSHPTPKVREATAIALGRLDNRASYEVLLALIGGAEPNQNVRLAARKALQALAGREDRKYDVEGWRKVFEGR